MDGLLSLLSYLFRKNLLSELAQEANEIISRTLRREEGEESIQQVFSLLSIPIALFSFPSHHPQCLVGEARGNSGDSEEKGRFPEEGLRLVALRIM